MDTSEKVLLAVLFLGSLAALWAGLTSTHISGLAWAIAAVVMVLLARLVQGNAHQREFNRSMKSLSEQLARIEKQKQD